MTVYLEGTEITDLRLMLHLAASPDYDLERLLLSAADYETVQAVRRSPVAAHHLAAGCLDYTIHRMASRLAPVPSPRPPGKA